jgi:hypothetical protein
MASGVPPSSNKPNLTIVIPQDSSREATPVSSPSDTQVKTEQVASSKLITPKSSSSNPPSPNDLDSISPMAASNSNRNLQKTTQKVAAFNVRTATGSKSPQSPLERVSKQLKEEARSPDATNPEGIYIKNPFSLPKGKKAAASSRAESYNSNQTSTGKADASQANENATAEFLLINTSLSSTATTLEYHTFGARDVAMNMHLGFPMGRKSEASSPTEKSNNSNQTSFEKTNQSTNITLNFPTRFSILMPIRSYLIGYKQGAITREEASDLATIVSNDFAKQTVSINDIETIVDACIKRSSLNQALGQTDLDQIKEGIVTILKNKGMVV